MSFLLDCPSHCGECSRGFLSLDDLIQRARFIPNFVEVQGELLTFPNLNITQDGYLVKWTFTAVELEQEDRTDYPVLQIWRGSSIVDSFSSFHSVPTGYPNVYEHVLKRRLAVKAGDYIGIEQPAENSARLLISFVPLTGQLGTSDQENKLLPLVTVEVDYNDGKASMQ